MWLLLCLLPTVLAHHTLEPPPPTPVSRSTPTEEWLPVRLNHFDASNNETFEMRYYYNDEFARDNHIVIFVGGEWAISPGWVTGGLAYELARRTSSGLFYTEHRYYGLTRPTSETTLSELRYLNVDQALGDLAQFIQHVKSDDFEGGRYKDGNVALVGCSYAGSMATWMRLAYPHLITTAMSDSGPLHAQEDFPEYLEVITRALRERGGAQCVSDVAEAIHEVLQLLETETGVETVSKMFNTCTPLQASSPMDVATFFWYGITETFAYLVQFATPGDIEDACNRITNSTYETSSTTRLASWVSAHPWTQPCIESRYSEQLARHTNTSYDAPQTTMRLWTYQTCIEYGWWQTTTSNDQPFQNAVPLQYFHQMCKDFFSDDINESQLRSGIERTNRLFGGLTHLPDHVLSVAGTLDPWSPMGPNTTHATPLAPVYMLPGVSHCRAISSPSAADTSELVEARLDILLRMDSLMTGLKASASTAVLSPLLVLCATIYYIGL